MKVGVVIPAFDVERFIADAIGSVIAQSHQDWAIVVVDDGSADGTAAAAERCAGARTRLRLLRQANAGVSAARNAGLAALDCDAVTFLDADDWLAPDALSRLAAALPENSVAAYGPYAFVDEAARPGAAPHVGRSGRLPSGDVLPALLERNLLANGGHALIRRDAMERAGGFRSDLSYGEDWECWVRLALLGPFAIAAGRAPLLHVRRRAGGAYLRMADDPASFRPCMDAIFRNPALRARLGDAECDAARVRAEAENDWIVGRELIRHGRAAEGRRWLRRSAAAKPSARRAALTLAAHALPALRPAWRGPFRAYRA